MNQACTLIGAALALLLLSGCGTTVNPVATTTIPGFATTLYVNNYDTDGLNQISVYSVIQSSTPSTIYPASAPSTVATLTLPTGLLAGLMATDGAGNLYIATSSGILEYAAGASGLATPVRAIPMSSTTTLAASGSNGYFATNIEGLAVDPPGNIYVSEYGAGIAIFSSTANGNVAPARYILGNLQTGGGFSTIQSPGQIAVDGAGNTYVANFVPGSGYDLLVFGPAANGNVAPIRTLSVEALALAVDPSGNIYSWPFTVTNSGVASWGIAVFAAGSSGSATPTRTIDELWDVDSLSADSLGNLFAADGSHGPPATPGCLGTPGVLQFSPTESGLATTTAPPTAGYPGGMIQSCNGPAIAIH